jgi:hypothetical protein
VNLKHLTPLIATAAVLGVAGDAAAAGYVPHTICGSRCGVLQTSAADGTIRVDGRGTAYGPVDGSATIKLKDRTADGKQGFSVSGWSSRARAADGWWVYRGRNMSFFAQDAFGLRIRGGQAYIRVVADGKAYVQGRGRYAVNGGSWRTITSSGANVSL